MSLSLNMDLVAKQLSIKVTSELTALAEPIIQDALAEIEKKMRERLAAMAASIVDANYEMERMGTNLVIRVKLNGHDTDKPK